MHQLRTFHGLVAFWPTSIIIPHFKIAMKAWKNILAVCGSVLVVNFLLSFSVHLFMIKHTNTQVHLLTWFSNIQSSYIVEKIIWLLKNPVLPLSPFSIWYNQQIDPFHPLAVANEISTMRHRLFYVYARCAQSNHKTFVLVLSAQYMFVFPQFVRWYVRLHWLL